jgi:ABC-type polysaccharide/polyol phosphate export permease
VEPNTSRKECIDRLESEPQSATKGGSMPGIFRPVQRSQNVQKNLNPIVGVIDGFRWAISRGTSEIYIPAFTVSMAIVALFLLLGIRYFRKTERTFADPI